MIASIEIFTCILAIGGAVLFAASEYRRLKSGQQQEPAQADPRTWR
jgi:hypothetical protein